MIRKFTKSKKYENLFEVVNEQKWVLSRFFVMAQLMCSVAIAFIVVVSIVQSLLFCSSYLKVRDSKDVKYFSSETLRKTRRENSLLFQIF